MGPTKIVQLCASHIDSLDRLYKLEHNLKGFVNDDTIFFIVSLSFDEEYITHVQDLQNKHPSSLHVHLQRKSQFEHYCFLASLEFDSGIEWWVMFFDDDDVCHPLRHKVYSQFIDNNDIVYIDECALYELNRPFEYCNQEYFAFACKLDIFRYFFIFNSNYLFAINGCDLIFRNYLRALPNCKIVSRKEWQAQVTNTDWLYIHGLKTNCQHATFTVNMKKLTLLSNEMTTKLRNIHGSDIITMNVKVFKDLVDKL